MASVQRIIARLADELVAADPVLATSLGRTDGLDSLPSFSRDAVAARVALARRGIDELAPAAAAGPADRPPAAATAEAAVFLPVLWRLVRRYESLRVHQMAPGSYLDVAFEALMPLLLRDLAPEDERVRALESRLRALPGMLEEARANLEPGLPRVFVENAVELCEGLIRLAGKGVRDFAAGVRRPGSLDVASAAAVGALASYREFLRDKMLPVTIDRCASGRAVITDILRREHMLDETPEQIAALGRSIIAETQAEMRALAADMGAGDAGAAVAAVRAAHPAFDDLVPEYRRAVSAARDFVVTHDLVTLVEGAELEVTATPEYLRNVLPFAAYDPPGPFAARQLGYYYVTPPPPGDAAGLAAHPMASMPTTGVHEAFPGHHVQLTRANRAPSLARRLAGAYEGGDLLAEGWAFYCEEMMERQGFLAAPEVRLMRLNDQVWRACRVVIDAEVAVGRMPFTEAVDLLVREARMDPRLADLEVRRYVENPGTPMSYLLGKREVIALAREFARTRSASLKVFHDALLDWGSVSPRLIAWGLGLGPRPAAFAA
ncbi:MAG TPA: DUF885 domain-containing protein [Thermoleophilia bacterium]|nr:DUF885 domain-containing protein [Thermoleophilia bacterium]